MPVVWLKLPEVKNNSNNRPQCCPHCGSNILQRWGRVTKPVQDAQNTLAELYRYRCSDCLRTFRHYPEGLDRAGQTQRIRQIAGLVWTMGLSTREVSDVFRELGLDISRTTVWREGQNLVKEIDEGDESDYRRRYAIDRTYIHNISTKLGVVVALDMGQDNYVVLGTLDEYNPWLVKDWAEALIQGVEVDVAVLKTDTLNGYVPMSQEYIGLRP